MWYIISLHSVYYFNELYVEIEFGVLKKKESRVWDIGYIVKWYNIIDKVIF